LKIFVTGHLGYIGTQLVDVLMEEGHEVTGCDLNLFRGCEWRPRTAPHRELIQDLRTLSPEDLAGHDAVMHLGAISNDPMGDLDGALTEEVNLNGTVRLAEAAKRAGVPRFLFAGSCSVYGKGVNLDVSEEDAVAPLTVYARSKIESEQRVSELANDAFTPVFLRNATAYGDSPMLRLDLVVNNLLASALAYGEIRIMSDGSPWRPLIHCRDIARAFVALARAPRPMVHNQVINVGANSENYQVRDVADAVQELLPRARITYTGEVGSDPRNYRVNFDRLYRLLPDFELEYDVPRGLEELHRSMVSNRFDKEMFESDRFIRIRTLQKRVRRLQSLGSESESES
jgi:nucleoside-diphosphate-sugar epimerase